MYVTQMCSIWK